jgi:tetratricopeptide (TPR) repeat protein
MNLDGLYRGEVGSTTTTDWSKAVRKAIDAKKPRAVHRAACAAQDAGDYAAALLGISWVHRKALRHDESYDPVRLSFGLADWVRLGKVYAPARALYDETLHLGTERVLAGRGGWALFAEVAAMYEYLGQSHKVIELFRAVEVNFPKRAPNYFIIVRESLDEVGDYVTCLRYVDPERQLEHDLEFLAFQLNLVQRFLLEGRVVRIDPLAKFANRLGVLLEILCGSGHADEAREVHQRALTRVDTIGTRRALTSARNRAIKRQNLSDPLNPPGRTWADGGRRTPPPGKSDGPAWRPSGPVLSVTSIDK